MGLHGGFDTLHSPQVNGVFYFLQFVDFLAYIFNGFTIFEFSCFSMELVVC